MFDVNGQFIFPAGVEWTSITTDGIDSLADLLKALDTVIKANADKFASYYDKDSVDGLLKAFAKSVDVKVNDTTTISGSVDEEGKISIDLSSAFDAAGKVKDVTVDGTSVVNEDGIANITIPEVEVPFQSVAVGDKVLTLNQGILSSTLSYAREQVEGVDSLVLKGIDGVVIGSVSVADFVADGMLESVAPVEGTNKFKFTFKKVDGSTEDFEVDFGQFVDTYHADGETIELDSTTNTFSVKEVKATKTKLTEDITIAGGPLANNVIETGDEWPWKDAAGNKIIPSGKSMEEILTGLFLKVIEGTVSFGNVSWSPSVAQPTVTLSKTGTIEVGTKVKVTALTNGAFNKAKRSITLTTDQGYFDGNTYYSDKSKTFYSAESSASGTETITCKWNNVATDVTVNETELVAAEGTNTLAATQSGLVATVSAIPDKTVYASTNTKTKLTDTTPSKKQVATIDEAQDTYTSDILSSSKNATVTAYYPIYTNGKQGTANAQSNETTLVADDATKLNLVADNTIFYVLFAPMIDGGTGYRLLVKSGKIITQAMALNTLNGKYEVNMKDSFVKADGTVKKLSGGVEIDYDVYEAKGSAGANAIQFKID